MSAAPNELFDALMQGDLPKISQLLYNRVGVPPITVHPSPLPWTLVDNHWEIWDDNQTTVACVGSGDVGGMADIQAAVDARLIVRAVNAHQALIDGVNALLGLITLVCARDDMPLDIKTALETSHRLHEAVDALSKAGAR